MSRRRDRGENIPQLRLPLASTLVLHRPGIIHDLFAVSRAFALGCVPALLLNPCVWQGAGTGGDGNTLSGPCRGGQRLDRVAADWGEQVLLDMGTQAIMAEHDKLLRNYN